MSIRVRFAPSPTGALHIGGLRTALFNYLFAKKHNGEFILRIEDTDQNRKVDGAEDYITASLSWLGIEQDEGPKKRGGFGPYRQSERKEIYEQEIIKLIQTGKAYYAFDSDEKLAELRREYEKKGESFKYCSLNRNDLLNSLSLSEKETKKRIKEENYVVRLKVESGISVTVEDKIRGEIKVNSDEIDDKILIKADGMPTYHFANVVDDHHMKISHVIRGEEWLPSLPLHQLIYYAFDWTVPEFMHLPLILKPEGKGKLSKRDGDQLGFPVYPLKWNGNIGFKERGFLPEALLNYISLLGWNPGAEKEIFELEELIRLFDIGKIQKGGARFDFNKARWINHKFIERSESKSVLERFPAFFSIMSIVKSEKNKLAIYELLKERLFLLEDFKSEANLLFNDPTTYDEKIIKKIENSRLEKTLNLIIELIEKDIPAANWKQELQTWNEKVNIPFGVILQSLRLAIVGSLSGPDIFSVCGLLEKEVTLRRLKKLIIYLNN
jgi:glutamyl-tRNA synthetase